MRYFFVKILTMERLQMKKMFKEMRQSLKEKIGSVNKDFLVNHI